MSRLGKVNRTHLYPQIGISRHFFSRLLFLVIFINVVPFPSRGIIFLCFALVNLNVDSLTHDFSIVLYIYIYRKVRLMKRTHDSLLLRVSCLRTHQTVFNTVKILSDECVSTNLGVTVNHVFVSLALPFYDLALHLCVLSTI